jgi:hypothetical protein
MLPQMQAVESSNISAIGYDQDTDELFIEFKNGNVYVYKEVPFEMYTAMMDADSKGSFFYKHIRQGGYSYAKL